MTCSQNRREGKNKVSCGNLFFYNLRVEISTKVFRTCHVNPQKMDQQVLFQDVDNLFKIGIMPLKLAESLKIVHFLRYAYYFYCSFLRQKIKRGSILLMEFLSVFFVSSKFPEFPLEKCYISFQICVLLILIP